MERGIFHSLTATIVTKIGKLIETKGVAKYATEIDAHHNFRAVAKKRGITLGQALQGMADKHEIVVDDMMSGMQDITEKLIWEHAMDRVVYAVLTIPVLYEMMEEQEAILSAPTFHEKDYNSLNEAIAAVQDAEGGVLLCEPTEEQEAVSATAPTPQTIIHNAECDTCSEQDKGYARALKITEDTLHRQERLHDPHCNPAYIMGLKDALEELRKERR